MALDICENVKPEVRNRYESLCSDPKAAAEESDVSMCAATLPHFYQRVEESVYQNHMKPLSQSRGTKMPDSSLEEPFPCKGRSGTLMGLKKPILAGDEIWNIDLDAENRCHF